MRHLLLISLLLTGCASVPAELLDISSQAKDLPATKSLYGNCQDHTNAVARAAIDMGYSVSVLRVCSSWFRSGCHVAAIVVIDGEARVLDNGALGLGEAPTLEEVGANYERLWIFPADYILARFP